jgi:hypothetical protein
VYLMGFHESGSVRLQELQAMQDAEQRYVRLRDLGVYGRVTLAISSNVALRPLIASNILTMYSGL